MRLDVKAGFSLIELMVVCALLCFMATLVFVQTKYLHHCLVRQEAEKLILVGRSMQQMAIVTKKVKILTIDPNLGTYHGDECSEKLCSSVKFGFIPGTKGPPSDPTKKLEFSITFDHNSITFYPDGIIKPGTLYLVSEDQQVMYAVSSPVAECSALHLYRYHGSWESLS